MGSRHLLVLRFSSLGDVALSVPVVHGVLNANPDVQITYVSNKLHAPLFQEIDRLHFHGLDLEEYAGPVGLFRLYRELRKMESWEVIIDLHSVLRTWILTGFFKQGGFRVHSLAKGRKEKEALTRRKNKDFRELPHTTQRYTEVFIDAGYEVSIPESVRIRASQSAEEWSNQFVIEQDGRQMIGIAPFSKHEEKEWPRHHLAELMKDLDAKGIRLLLFGGPHERAKLDELALPFNHTQNLAGVISLDQQIALMSNLAVFVSMDSFNMHLASLCGTPCLSIWGPTHPHAGFRPWDATHATIIQITNEELDCRPCSVFGSKRCFRGDHACMEWITPEKVIQAIHNMLK